MDDLAMTEEFEQALNEVETEGGDRPLGEEVEQFLDQQQRTVMRAIQRIVVARRKGKAAIAAIDADKKSAEADYLAVLARLNEAEAKARSEMEAEIATAQKLAAGGRAALQAVQP